MKTVDEKRGFSGLSDLASDVSKIEDAPASPPSEQAPSPPHPIQISKDVETPKVQRTCTPIHARKSLPLKKPAHASWKWILVPIGLLGVIVILSIIKNPGNNYSQNAESVSSGVKKYVYSPDNTKHNGDSYDGSSAPNARSEKSNIYSPTDQGLSAEHSYEKPPVGTANTLTIAQIRWCTREKIKLNTIKRILDSYDEASVDGFNRLVDDYNCRCGNFKYHPGSLEQARREVQDHKNQIEKDAMVEACKLGLANKSFYPSKSPAQKVPVNVLPTPTPLSDANAYMGSNEKTVDSYESNNSQATTEWNRPIDSNITDEQKYITRGSHQDDVLRIQGTPDSIADIYSYEMWHYGYSTINISKSDHRVKEWNNSGGNLKVRLLPGSNITGNTYFTRGSHQDDVLKIQGTPDSISDIYSYEMWHYGYSTINISKNDHRVKEWNNSGGNLRVELEPEPNVTSSSYYTRGSSEDDVLRIQGKPEKIIKYPEEEVWFYDASSVRLSASDKRVISWDNYSGNLKVR